MKTYAKGVRFERELLHYLRYRGFAVARQASSGGRTTPVDVIALRKGLALAIECKSYTEKPVLPRERMERLREWCTQAGAIGLLAWKKPGGDWCFLRLEDAEAGAYDDERWLGLDQLMQAFAV